MAQELGDRSFTVPSMLSEDSFTSSSSAFAPYAGTKGAAPVVGDTLLVYHVLLFADSDSRVDLGGSMSLIFADHFNPLCLHVATSKQFRAEYCQLMLSDPKH